MLSIHDSFSSVSNCDSERGCGIGLQRGRTRGPFLNAVIAESFSASSAPPLRTLRLRGEAPFSCMLIEDLQNHHQQFQSIKLDAQDLLANLTDIQFTWQPDLDRWSIAQCIDHLLVTGNNSISKMRIAITEARSKRKVIWSRPSVISCEDAVVSKTAFINVNP